MYIDRKELIKELNEEQKLRSNIQRAIKIIFERKQHQQEELIFEEQKLRSIIQTLIKEAAADVQSDVPHQKTGINVLETLLKKIIPVLEDDYKSLTTDEEQRKSFRAHIVQAVKNSLAPQDVLDAAGEEEDLDEQNVKISVEDEPEKFIPVRGVDIETDTDEEEPEEEGAFTIPGEDMTGRNFAYQSYNKVETQILDSYGSLQNDEDKELFYDYLLTNLKLYFDKFEDELAASIEEPTTPEYEKEKEEEAAEEMDAEEIPEEEAEEEADMSI